MATIFIPTPLRPFAGGKGEEDIDAATLGELLKRLVERHPDLAAQLFDATGGLRRFVTIFINDEDARVREGLDTCITTADTVEILPAIAGGSGAFANFADLRRSLEGSVWQVPPEVAIAAVPAPLVLDVRTTEEWSQGHLPWAHHVDRGFLELRIEALAPDREQPILCYCASGTRSLLAADALRQIGYRNVASLTGGILAWRQAGYEIVVPRLLDEQARRRYRRHLAIAEVGEEGQQRLLDASVLVIGAGGLGSPTLLYLAAAGVGTIAIVDDDVVDESNLQRQVVHRQATVGMLKTESARDALLALNPSIKIDLHSRRLDVESANALVPRYDVIVDGTDNFSTRYLINDAAVHHDRPVVHGSVYRFEGQVSVFWRSRGPCYRCLYPEAPPPELAPSCAEAGVLGVLPGVIGLLQATETLKLLLKCGQPLIGQALRYDALAGTVRKLRFAKDPECAVCGSETILRSGEDAVTPYPR